MVVYLGVVDVFGCLGDDRVVGCLIFILCLVIVVDSCFVIILVMGLLFIVEFIVCVVMVLIVNWVWVVGGVECCWEDCCC